MGDDLSVTETALEAAMDWYEGKRSKKGNVNTNIMCVGLAAAELLKSYFPLTDDVVKSEEGSQVRGLSGSMVSRVLKEYGEEQEFTSEGGRTSRGSLPKAQELAEKPSTRLASPRSSSLTICSSVMLAEAVLRTRRKLPCA